MPKAKDYTGQKFNSLTAIKRERKNNRTYYTCVCDCGRTVEIAASSLGRNKTCGKCSTNSFVLKEDMGVGRTSKGEEFFFDLEDYGFIRQHSWSKTSNGYIAANIGGKKQYLHRILMETPDNKITDHINRIKHDNRKGNLRVVDRTINEVNKELKSTNVSGKTGVYFKKERQKWVAQITKDGKTYHLGSFENKEEAISIRQEKELELFGELNPIVTKEDQCVNLRKLEEPMME